MKKYNLYSLGEGVVKEYVRNSLYFNKLRSEYEQRIVKWQINWMKSGGGNWLVESGNDEYLFSTRCDYIFRKGIVDTLLAIGIDINAIEEAIEAYGTITSDMKMTEEEVENLEQYLQKQEKIRLDEIEKFKNRKNYQELSELKEMSQSDFYSLSYEDCLPLKQCDEEKKEKGLRKILKKLVK